MQPTNELVDEAVRLAEQAYAGKLDKAGRPAILHALRVGAAGKTWQEQVVGFLHDVLEDELLSDGVLRGVFGDEIMIALDSVTRQVKSESYRAYVARAAANAIGRPVKVADVKDNLGRLWQLPQEEAASMRRRYNKALEILGEDYL
jgi:(p)ppGpp synthase/HD superfamily hydrolase